MNRQMIIYGILVSFAAVGQIVLAILLYNPQGNILVINLGWGVMMLSAIFGWVPIFTLRRKGGVQGRSYIHTTRLVVSGIYGIVRHPQYLAGILMSIALPLISQHWLVVLFGLLAVPIYYLNTFNEEAGCIKKFGDAYEEYRQQVPRLNFVVGIVRRIARLRKGGKHV